MKQNEGKISLKELCKGIEGVKVQGNKGVGIDCLALDSRKVIPGCLFFAISGFKSDGAYYAAEAVSRGAVAIVCEKPLRGVGGVAVVVVSDVRKAMAQMARRFFDFPDEELKLVGVTGTNGKTTVSVLTQFLLREETEPVGMMGTIKYDLGDRTLPSSKTTPESIDVLAMMEQMVNSGCKLAVMEVSSHGIALKRIQDMAFDVGVFLNLTREHLDFHKDMECYYGEKLKLFQGEVGQRPKSAIINIDDAYGERMVSELPEGTDVLTFGTSRGAMIRAEDVVLSANGVSFTLHYPGGEVAVESTLLGHFNVKNILASLAIAHALGKDMSEIVKKLPSFCGVRGRMERIEVGQEFNVLVDYAHTDDALENGLSMLREITPGRLLVVFGCGGNRDRTKRPKMTAAVQRWADYAWATADNPRKETLECIFDDMKEGVSDWDKINFVVERRRAIDRALTEAQPGDCVLIAGKGHETYQIVGDIVVPFDDSQVARELLKFKEETCATV